MSSSTFGTLFQVSTFGESHGKGVGAVVDGCPPRLPLTEADIQPQLDRRRPGQSAVSTPRQESDTVTILSGTENGLTLGTPIGLLVPNKDQRPGDYGEMAKIPRPSHADFTYQAKYGVRASSGGGRSSARETIARVAAGAIAEKWLRLRYGLDIVAWVSAVGELEAPGPVSPPRVTGAEVDRTIMRCPDLRGGRAHDRGRPGRARGGRFAGRRGHLRVPQRAGGLGEPVFDKLEARLAQAMLSLPATKGFEIGSGFRGARMRGSQHNDPFVQKGPTAWAPPPTTAAASRAASATASPSCCGSPSSRPPPSARPRPPRPSMGRRPCWRPRGATIRAW
jgi:chorismate synthase